MTDKEKIDALMEFLTALYEIKANTAGENKTLDYKIRVYETRLLAMGCTDLEKLKP